MYVLRRLRQRTDLRLTMPFFRRPGQFLNAIVAALLKLCPF
jgi:hypothetical protein